MVEEQRFDARSDLGSPTMLGLCSDVGSGAYYAFDASFIFEVDFLTSKSLRIGTLVARLLSMLCYHLRILSFCRWCVLGDDRVASVFITSIRLLITLVTFVMLIPVTVH